MLNRRRGTWLVVATVVMAGCGDRELATEHIRAMLDGAAPAAIGRADAPVPDASSPAASSGDGVSAREREGEPAIVSLPNGDTLHVRAAVADYYRARAYEPGWTDHRALSRSGSELLAAIESLENDGLDPARYHHDTARDMAEVLAARDAGDRRLEYLGSLDVLLVEGFVRAAMAVGTGVLDPERVGLSWRFERAQASDSVVVAKLAAGEEPAAILASLRPTAPYYHRLAGALEALRAVEAAGGWPAV